MGERAHDALIARGRARWPRLELEPEVFGAWLRERSRGGDATSLNAEDLWLACACARQVAGALEAFEAEHRATIRAALSRLPEADRDDVAQALRLKLFTGAPPGIAAYSGAGSLGGWVRITLARLVINAVSRGGDDVAEDDAVLSKLSADGDPELQAAKAELKGGFRAVLVTAFAALHAADRQLLRQALSNGATVDQLAVALGLPRSTAGRHMKAARDRFAAQVRLELERQLGAGSLSARQLLQLVESQLEGSWWRLSQIDEPQRLATPNVADPTPGPPQKKR